MEYSPVGETCSPSGGYMGLKQLSQWHWKDPRKKKKPTKSLRRPFFTLILFQETVPLSSPSLCKCAFCPVKSHGFGFHTHFSLSVL